MTADNQSSIPQQPQGGSSYAPIPGAVPQAPQIPTAGQGAPAQPAPVQPSFQQPGAYPTPQPGAPQAPYAAPVTYGQPAPTPYPGIPQQGMPQAMPAAYQDMPAAIPQQAATRTNIHTESWFGSKVVGVIAALLVLSGLVVLGVSFIPQLSDVVKTVLLFLFAVGLTAGGTLMVLRSRNALSYILLCSGILAFFVAAIVTHAHFALYSHTAMLIVVGVWMAVSVALLYFTRSWVPTLVMLCLAGLVGVAALEAPYYMETPASDFAVYLLVSLYSMALGAVCIALALRNGQLAPATQRSRCFAGLFVTEAALLWSGLVSSWAESGACTFILLGALLLALKFLPRPAALAQSEEVFRINELAALFGAAFIFLWVGLFGVDSRISVALYGVFTALVAVLVGLRAFDLSKAGRPRNSSAFPALEAAAATGVFTQFLSLSGLVSSPYVWTVAGMACALLSLAAGFYFNEKPLRLFGLVLTLLCVVKIALFDFSGNSLTTAIALVVAGLLCFAISALYTYANKKLS